MRPKDRAQANIQVAGGGGGGVCRSTNECLDCGSRLGGGGGGTASYSPTDNHIYVEGGRRGGGNHLPWLRKPAWRTVELPSPGAAKRRKENGGGAMGGMGCREDNNRYEHSTIHCNISLFHIIYVGVGAAV